MGDSDRLRSQMPSLFVAALKSFVIEDLLDLPGAFLRVVGMFADFVGKFISWGLDAAWNLLEIVFDVVSPRRARLHQEDRRGAEEHPEEPAALRRQSGEGGQARAAELRRQHRHPSQDRADRLADRLADRASTSRKALSLVEIGKFALSVLGLAWAQIRGKIVKALGPTGETIMKGLEKPPTSSSRWSRAVRPRSGN